MNTMVVGGHPLTRGNKNRPTRTHRTKHGEKGNLVMYEDWMTADSGMCIRTNFLPFNLSGNQF